MANTTTILIVDDSEIGRSVLESLLFSPEYNLAFAENGSQALELAAKIVPDLILLDVMMPGMDGFEVCQRLRNDPLLAEIQVIMVTALDDSASRLRGFEVGADDFIHKPYNRLELLARVRTISRLNRYRKLLDERANIEKAHQSLLQAYDAVIEGWSRAMDMRDKETEGHTQRVAELTTRLAKMIGMDDQSLVEMRRGALLHDIGKLGVPDAILLKPGKLTEEEWIIMRKHPQYSFEMLSPDPYLRYALDITYCHHEKWDGSGYPRGLKGEEIPLSARLFAFADVWDALTSDRPYRAALTPEAAVQYIRESAGTHFDPRYVDTFLEIVQSRLEQDLIRLEIPSHV